MYLQHVLPLRFHEIHKLRILVIISYDYWSTHIVYLVGIYAREDSMRSPFLGECIWCEELEEKDE